MDHTLKDLEVLKPLTEITKKNLPNAPVPDHPKEDTLLTILEKLGQNPRKPAIKKTP